MRLTCIFLLIAGCNSEGLSTEVATQGLACSARIDGSFTYQVGANAWPKALAYLSDHKGGPIAVGCERENNSSQGGPQLTLWIPPMTGAFTAAADFSSSSPDLDFKGSCEGNVDQVALVPGDWFRGTFTCGALDGVVDTHGSISVSDGQFDLQVQSAPPQ
jgi:hypothetical protein